MDEKQLDTVRYIRLADNRCEGDLTAPKFEDYPGPTVKTAGRRLDCTWNEAKEAAGVGINRVVGAGRGEIREDVERVAEELGKKPSYEDYNEYGRHSTGPIRRRFGDGSWNDGLEELGFVPQWEQDVEAREMERDLLGLATALDRTPSSNEYGEMGRYATNVVIVELGDGSWNDACRAVELDPNDHPQEHVDDELADVERVAELYESGMTTQELATKYNCNPESVSWRLKQEGYEVRGPGYNSVYCDILDTWVDSKTERDFVRALSGDDLLDVSEYHPEPIYHGGSRWEPDFIVNGWLVECKQGTWGGTYDQADIMAACDEKILVYGLEEDIEALPHDESIVRRPGEVPDLPW